MYVRAHVLRLHILCNSFEFFLVVSSTGMEIHTCKQLTYVDPTHIQCRSHACNDTVFCFDHLNTGKLILNVSVVALLAMFEPL